MNVNDFDMHFAAALVAGHTALTAATPVPMTVKSGSQTYFVADGPCGFAWIRMSVKGNTALGRHLKALGWRKGYYGGYEWSVRDGEQSVQRKEAFAEAAAEYLRKAGYPAYADSRLD